MNINDLHERNQVVEGRGLEVTLSGMAAIQQPRMTMGAPTQYVGNQRGLPLPPVLHKPQGLVGKKRGHDGSLSDMQPSKKKRKKSKKRPRDPNAPKRPQTAYLIFYRKNVQSCLKMKPEFVNKNGNVDMTMVSKFLGQRWKELDPDKKKEFRDEYEKQKEKYEEELNQYNLRKKFDLQHKEAHSVQVNEGVLPTGMEETLQTTPAVLQQISHMDPGTMSYEDVLNEWKGLKVEKQHMIARLNFLRQSFEKFRGNFKSLTADLNYLLEYLK